MKNVALPIQPKQHRLILEKMLLAIAITACTGVEAPPSVATASPTSGSSIASNSTQASSPTPSASNAASPFLVAQNTSEANLVQQQAVQVIRNYYSAIARRDYAAAYSAWEGNGASSGQSFEQFRQGFSNTACTAVEVGEPGEPDAAVGSIYIEIPVTVTAITKNGTPQRFQGSYVLRRVNNVPGSTATQRQWHLHSANLAQVN